MIRRFTPPKIKEGDRDTALFYGVLLSGLHQHGVEMIIDGRGAELPAARLQHAADHRKMLEDKWITKLEEA